MEFKPPAMEFRHRDLVFWGVEVQSGKPRQVKIRDNIVHLSQACLRVPKKNKANEIVTLFVEIDNKKIVLGTLSTENLPQQQFDLVFRTNFKLSHDWKNGSVFFYGYKTEPVDYFETVSDESDSESEHEDTAPMILNNEKKEAHYLNSEDESGEETLSEQIRPYTCMSCNKTFASDEAFESHNKDKHSSIK